MPKGLVVNFELPKNQEAILAIPVFRLAKEEGIGLDEAAHKISNLLSGVKNVEFEVAGGFVNVRLTEELYNKALFEAGQSDFGQTEIGRSKTIVIDYSSPNIAKPMSVGHLRSTVIGDALKRLYLSQGYRVVGINFLGDWGTQFGKLLVAYKDKFGDFEPRAITLDELLELYVDFHSQAERNQSLEDEARRLFARLDSGDQEVKILWQHLVDISKKELSRIYTSLGILDFELMDGESNHLAQAESIIELAKARGISTESEGALIVDLPELGTPLLLKKKDGATLYASRDLAAIKERVGKYNPEKIIYVVANEQSLHFQQLFSVAGQLGLAPNTELIHAKFGLISLPEGKMSTRQGRVVFLEDVIEEVIEKAGKIVKDKNPEFSDGQIGKIAQKVGVGALKFYDLANNRLHDIVFNWEKMLALNGQAAPYLQYSYTRAESILSKAADFEPGSDLNLKPYRDQIKMLAKLPLVIGSALEKNSPHLLAQYLFGIAGEFHAFYEKYPVLKAEADRPERLLIVKAFANVLKNGLDLLGIEVSERM